LNEVLGSAAVCDMQSGTAEQLLWLNKKRVMSPTGVPGFRVFEKQNSPTLPVPCQQYKSKSRFLADHHREIFSGHSRHKKYW